MAYKRSFRLLEQAEGHDRFSTAIKSLPSDFLKSVRVVDTSAQQEEQPPVIEQELLETAAKRDGSDPANLQVLKSTTDIELTRDAADRLLANRAEQVKCHWLFLSVSCLLILF